MDIIIFAFVGAVIFIFGFVVGDFSGFIRKEEQRMIKELLIENEKLLKALIESDKKGK